MSDTNIYIDFEFNDILEANVNPICVSARRLGLGGDYYTQRFWLRQKEGVENFLSFVRGNRDRTFVSFSVEAEARSFMALHLNPTNYKWICLWVGYKAILNNNDDLEFGHQLVKGKIIETFPPWKKKRYGFDARNFSLPETNYASACYNLLKVEIDTDRKKHVRDIIIEGSKVEEYKQEILDYCDDDVRHLPDLYDVIYNHTRHILGEASTVSPLDSLLSFGEYGARTALMQRFGYPIDKIEMDNLVSNTSELIRNLQKEINTLFPNNPLFKTNPSTLAMSESKAVLFEAIANSPFAKKWPTGGKKGDYSLKLDNFSKFIPERHNHDKTCILSQAKRYKQYKQMLGSFVKKAGKKNIWDYVGTDNHIRPYFNIYGSQSGRSQPSSTSYLFLKSAWIRTLCNTPIDKIQIELDYSSQEFLIAGLWANDKEMIKAYNSGDIYVYWAKQLGEMPEDGTKHSHPEIRNMFKSVVLGMQFGMSKIGLALKLTADTGKTVTEAQAQKYIRKFETSFPEYAKKKEKELRRYLKDGYTQLNCGWFMGPTNRNERSILNCPIQGAGSSIMRKAVALAQDKYGLDINMTLHDALFAYCHPKDMAEGVRKLGLSMTEAFAWYWPDDLKEHATIRLEGHIWGRGLVVKEEEKTIAGIECTIQPRFIDPRARKEVERFQPYLKEMHLSNYL